MASSFKKHFKRSNLQIQFWAYEGGNIIATIAGAGGPAAFVRDISITFQNDRLSLTEQVGSLATNYPDATVTVGLGATVLLAPVAKNIAHHCGKALAVNAVDVAATVTSVGILGYALTQDSSWITVAGSSFVLASSFLRQADKNPFLLKAGGVLLAFGGAALSCFGVDGLQQQPQNAEVTQTLMNVLTIGTGAYVVGAGSLTYEGGIFAAKAYKSEFRPSGELRGFAEKLLHPAGFLSKIFADYVDQSVQKFNGAIVKPSIWWQPKAVKDDKPFLTSMWARLPWRLMTGTAAAVTGTPAGLTFAAANAAWAIGDTAIGSMDWKDAPAALSFDSAPAKYKPDL